MVVLLLWYVLVTVSLACMPVSAALLLADDTGGALVFAVLSAASVLAAREIRTAAVTAERP